MVKLEDTLTTKFAKSVMEGVSYYPDDYSGRYSDQEPSKEEPFFTPSDFSRCHCDNSRMARAANAELANAKLQKALGRIVFKDEKTDWFESIQMPYGATHAARLFNVQVIKREPQHSCTCDKCGYK